MLNDKSFTGHAVVVGAGVMGTGIAALLANLGWRVDLLDRVPEGAGSDPRARNRLSQEGLERAQQSHPPHFALPEYAHRVRVGNVEDHLAWLQDADWVVEAVSEDSAVKKAVLQSLAAHVGPSAVITSTTAMLELARLTEGCPADFRARFLGALFFNPPRYTPVLEVIPTASTSALIREGFTQFADRILGKRIIHAKDTPGFLSTRLGIHAIGKAMEIAAAHGLTVEEADYLTGPLIGRPAGVFSLADKIGLDVLAHAVAYLQASLPDDPGYASLRLPEAVQWLVQQGRTGRKVGAGFYHQKADGSLLTFDLSALTYRPRREPTRFSQEIEHLPLKERLRRLWQLSPEHDAGFLQQMLRATLGYVADVTPDIADRIVDVDDAMIGGFGWERGPFHLLDILGHIEWPHGEPRLIARLRETSLKRFYTNDAGHHFYYDFSRRHMSSLHRPPDVIVLKDLIDAGRVIEETNGAALVEMGRGALCLEWRANQDLLDPDILAFMEVARRRVEREFVGLVVGGAGRNFCAGYDLTRLASRIEAQDWSGLEALLKRFQEAMLSLKYAAIPVVSMVSGRALGAGCAVLLHTADVQAAFESYIGMPEARFGLLPTGGGLTQMLFRATQCAAIPVSSLPAFDPFPFLQVVWDNLRLARISSCADEARRLGYLLASNGVVYHPDRLLRAAKERVLALAAVYRPPLPPTIPVPGESGLARFREEIERLRCDGQMAEQGAPVAERLAHVLCGGALPHPAEVTEQYLLDLEREAFLSLAGLPQTLARLQSARDAV